MEVNEKEIIYIWDNLPTRGYGSSYVLIVKASSSIEAWKSAVNILENAIKENRYVLPEGVDDVKAIFLLADSPEMWYLDRFDGKLICIYE